ncbi:MAG: nuclear transport factor 2 family protein [Blastococcus sp.]
MTTDDDTRAAIARFDEAINDHDLDALAAAMTDDCIWEDTAPPDGNRHEGRAAVPAAMAPFVAGAPNAGGRRCSGRPPASRHQAIWRITRNPGWRRGESNP